MAREDRAHASLGCDAFHNFMSLSRHSSHSPLHISRQKYSYRNITRVAELHSESQDSGESLGSRVRVRGESG